MIKRRHFLQCSTATLASLGLNTLNLRRQVHRYGRALAQPTCRKRALLIGINDYAGQLRTLKGCVPDVDLQKELLMHRVGFIESDILTLKNEAATRNNILNAFRDHLINACGEGDVAVFHFSGHGRRVSDRSHFRPFSVNAALPPAMVSSTCTTTGNMPWVFNPSPTTRFKVSNTSVTDKVRKNRLRKAHSQSSRSNQG